MYVLKERETETEDREKKQCPMCKSLTRSPKRDTLKTLILKIFSFKQTSIVYTSISSTLLIRATDVRACVGVGGGGVGCVRACVCALMRARELFSVFRGA